MAPLVVLGIALPPFTVAMAQDDGGGDDGESDDGGSDDGGSDDGGTTAGDDDDDDGGTKTGNADDDRGLSPASTGSRGGLLERMFGSDIVQPEERRQPARRPAAFAPELIVSGLSEADLATLQREGFRLIERRAIGSVGTTIDRLAVPRGRTLAEGRARVRRLTSGGDADFNHFYRPTQDEAPAQGLPDECGHDNCPHWRLIDWPSKRSDAGSCGKIAPIGLIDTGINPDHDTLRGARLTLLSRSSAQEAGSRAVHGTAIASLIAGRPGSRVEGLLPDAEILAVDVFSSVAGDERADAGALVEGLDLLAQRGVRVINMSLSGPPNAVLATMLDRLTSEPGLDAVVVAAAGNGGPTAEPAWPAAHPRVIAVTALDPRGRVYRRAQRGEHLGLAAPGVNLLVATSIRGARAASGTSFAVPFVTAAAALALGHGEKVPAATVRERLFAGARDLGAPGRDPIFGHGAVTTTDLCAASTP